MNIPKDPSILLSYINTELRDYYNNLDELCKSLDISREYIEEKLKIIDYEYCEQLNKFI